MDIISLYNDAIERVAAEQNGSLTISQFNRYNRIAELRALDYLTGDVEGVKPPTPGDNQKLRDWLSVFISKKLLVVNNGEFEKPTDYYLFGSSSVIGSYRDDVCGKDTIVSKGDTPIEILDGQQFEYRCGTHIRSLKPSMTRPIGRMVGNNILTMPNDLGSVTIYYIRYPKFGEVKVMVDPVYNNEVPDPINSVNSEWPEFARNFLLYFIVQQYPARTRERAITEQNELINKKP